MRSKYINLHRITKNRGQTTVLVGLLMGLGVLLGFVGLAVDGGSALVQRRNMQNGADGAAMGAAKTLASSVVVSGTAYMYMVTNANMTARVEQLLAGNRGGVTRTPNYSTTLEYGTFISPTNTYTYHTAATYYSSTWHYANGYAANSLVPAAGSTSTDAVRVSAAIDNPTSFAQLIGINTITVSAKAASMLNAVQQIDYSGQRTLPMTRCWFPSGAPDPAYGICNPYLFWSSNMNDPGCPTNANFKNLVQLGKRQGSSYQDVNPHDQLLTQFDSRSAQTEVTNDNNPCGMGAAWSGHWSPAGGCTDPTTNPPASYGNTCCANTSQMKEDVQNWIENGFYGTISLNSIWPTSYFRTGYSAPPGDWLEVYNGGDAGNNIVQAMQDVISREGQSDRFVTNYGSYVDRAVYLYDIKEKWQNGDWVAANGGAPNRVHIKQAYMFRFYQKLIGSGGGPTKPSDICGTSPAPNVGNSEVYGIFVGTEVNDPPCPDPPCQVGHGMNNYVGYLDP